MCWGCISFSHTLLQFLLPLYTARTEHVHVIQVSTSFLIFWRLCWGLSRGLSRGTPCVLTVQSHTGSPQPLSRHSGFYSCSMTSTTSATANVKSSVAHIGHSGTKKVEHNLNSVLPYFKSIITPTSTTWHGTHLLWWWPLAAISVWGTEILWGHSNRHLAYPPQTDVDRLIEASTTNLSPLQHISSSKPRGVTPMTQYIGDEGRSQACGHWDHASQPLECACITQPQGPTEEFSDTLSLTREQTTPHTGA